MFNYTHIPFSFSTHPQARPLKGFSGSIHTYIHNSYFAQCSKKLLNHYGRLIWKHTENNLVGRKRKFWTNVTLNGYRKQTVWEQKWRHAAECSSVPVPATGKARSPMVTSRVGLTVSRADDDERRRWRLVSEKNFSPATDLASSQPTSSI